MVDKFQITFKSAVYSDLTIYIVYTTIVIRKLNFMGFGNTVVYFVEYYYFKYYTNRLRYYVGT